jgi:hypothetical protein
MLSFFWNEKKNVGHYCLSNPHITKDYNVMVKREEVIGTTISDAIDEVN